MAKYHFLSICNGTSIFKTLNQKGWQMLFAVNLEKLDDASFLTSTYNFQSYRKLDR